MIRLLGSICPNTSESKELNACSNTPGAPVFLPLDLSACETHPWKSLALGGCGVQNGKLT